MSANPTYTPRRRPTCPTTTSTRTANPNLLASLTRALRAATGHPAMTCARRLVITLLRTLALQLTEWTRAIPPTATRFWARLVAHPISTALAKRANVPVPLIASVIATVALVLCATRPAQVAGVLVRAVPAHAAVYTIESPTAHPNTVILAKQLLLTLTLLSVPRTTLPVVIFALTHPHVAAECVYETCVRPAAVALAHWVPGGAGMPSSVKRAAWPAAAVPPPVVEIARRVVRVMREVNSGGAEVEWVERVDKWVRGVDAAVARDQVRPTVRAVDAGAPGHHVGPTTARAAPANVSSTLPDAVTTAVDLSTPRVIVDSAASAATESVSATPVVRVASPDSTPSTTDPITNDTSDDDDWDSDARQLALHLTTALPASGKASPVRASTAATRLAAGPGRRPRSASAVTCARTRPASGPRVVRGRAGSSA
ncbi:hypothetical protein GGF31_004270 [Allomyces arbusculus]|nr:hypothetical protein GGF31_004270 [Allomyces arbusculus]